VVVNPSVEQEVIAQRRTTLQDLLAQTHINEATAMRCAQNYRPALNELYRANQLIAMQSLTGAQSAKLVFPDPQHFAQAQLLISNTVMQARLHGYLAVAADTQLSGCDWQARDYHRMMFNRLEERASNRLKGMQREVIRMSDPADRELLLPALTQQQGVLRLEEMYHYLQLGDFRASEQSLLKARASTPDRALIFFATLYNFAVATPVAADLRCNRPAGLSVSAQQRNCLGRQARTALAQLNQRLNAVQKTRRLNADELGDLSQAEGFLKSGLDRVPVSAQELNSVQYVACLADLSPP
jgi:hypothetical protein